LNKEPKKAARLRSAYARASKLCALLNPPGAWVDRINPAQSLFTGGCSARLGVKPLNCGATGSTAGWAAAPTRWRVGYHVIPDCSL